VYYSQVQNAIANSNKAEKK